MFKHLLLLIFVPAFVYGQGTNVRTCTGYRPPPHEVRVRGCTSMPCTVRRGTEAIMDLEFTTPVSSNTLRPVVFASVLGATIEYPLPDHLQNACNHIRPNGCPLAAGTTTSYNFVFAVNPLYPPVTVGVEVNLLNQDNVAVTCFIVDIAVRF
ncbi:hypothetical protein HA402_015745 [Bradysia odoriphaga]|nr:hypothetical protein HA402_015745 [Bradysia odoriphaga]